MGDQKLPHQLYQLKLEVKRNQYRSAKTSRKKQLIEQKANLIKRQAVQYA